MKKYCGILLNQREKGERKTLAEIKLIATDLDGTFLQGGDTPHPENIKAVRECQEAGIKVCACTGRSFNHVKMILDEVKFDEFCVINNGASIIDWRSGKHRYRNRFDPNSIKDIVDVLLSYDAPFGLTGFDTVYMMEGYTSDWYNMLSQREREELNMYVYKSKEELVEACKDDVERMNLNLPFLQTFDDLSEKLGRVAEVEVTASGPSALEIAHADADKSQTLMVLADIYNVKPENVLAFGDSFNDMYMLAWAGTGVAMGNADPRLKTVADYITDTNVNAGVAKAIRRIALKRE